MEPIAVSIQEAARLTSLSVRTITRHIKAERIRGIRVGRRLLVPVASLQALVSDRPAIEADFLREGHPGEPS